MRHGENCDGHFKGAQLKLVAISSAAKANANYRFGSKLRYARLKGRRPLQIQRRSTNSKANSGATRGMRGWCWGVQTPTLPVKQKREGWATRKVRTKTKNKFKIKSKFTMKSKFKTEVKTNFKTAVGTKFKRKSTGRIAYATNDDGKD
jgi:hypothetical protein